jgi:hypothetical protein
MGEGEQYRKMENEVGSKIRIWKEFILLKGN